MSCLLVNAGYRCSRHYHRHKINLFGVASGSLLIVEWDERDDTTPRRTILNPGDVCAVNANVDHLFCVIESGLVVERYVSDNGQPVRADDIYRLDKGGKMQDGELERLRGQST